MQTELFLGTYNHTLLHVQYFLGDVGGIDNRFGVVVSGCHQHLDVYCIGCPCLVFKCPLPVCARAVTQ